MTRRSVVGDLDMDTVEMIGVDSVGDEVRDVIQIPAMSVRNIVSWTGRSAWAVEQQLEAIRRRVARGERVRTLVDRLVAHAPPHVRERLGAPPPRPMFRGVTSVGIYSALCVIEVPGA